MITQQPIPSLDYLTITMTNAKVIADDVVVTLKKAGFGFEPLSLNYEEIKVTFQAMQSLLEKPTQNFEEIKVTYQDFAAAYEEIRAAFEEIKVTLQDKGAPEALQAEIEVIEMRLDKSSTKLLEIAQGFDDADDVFDRFDFVRPEDGAFADTGATLAEIGSATGGGGGAFAAMDADGDGWAMIRDGDGDAFLIHAPTASGFELTEFTVKGARAYAIDETARIGLDALGDAGFDGDVSVAAGVDFFG
jgi:hypothetical protein